MELKYITPKEWIDALRSNEFKQGQNLLYNGEKDTYCCLGVACALAGIPKSDLQGNALSVFLPGECRSISNIVYYKLGLNDDHIIDLVDMNDKGSSFDEIANYIEYEFES